MKTYSQLISEADNSVILKKCTKKNGFSLPTTYKYDSYNKAFTYESSHGFRGEAAIRGVMEKLKNAGWTLYDKRSYDAFHPAGEEVSYYTILMSPDKSVIFKTNCTYGGTSWGNYYKGEFKLTTDEEEYLTQLNIKKEFEKTFNSYSFRFDTIKPNANGQPSARYGMYMPSKIERDAKLLDEYRKKFMNWKSIGEDKWENGDFIVELVPDRVGRELMNFEVTYIGKINPVKL